MEVLKTGSHSASAPAVSQASVSPQDAAERRELIKATRTINSAQALGGQNELVFILDSATHRAIIRVVDRDTKEVVMQVPPDYVLNLAQSITQRTS